MSDTQKQDPWYNCDHEWQPHGDYELGDVPGAGPREEVKCVKCGCPGERYPDSGHVDWPTT